MYFASIKDTLEDLTTVEYMRDCANQAGLETAFIHVEDIGWNEEKRCWMDLEENKIKNIFKLYPWEWMQYDEFSDNILKNDTISIQPSWKMILSNKAILPILWKLFPDNQYLLPSYFENEFNNQLNDYVKKPLLSREGANITIIKDEKTIEENDGDYGEDGYIIQKMFNVPRTILNNNRLMDDWL